MDTTERDAGMLLLLHPGPARLARGRAGYWLEVLVVLVVVAVAQRRLGPSSSATTSTVERALPSPAVQLTHDLAALREGSAGCLAWSGQTIAVRNDASPPRRTGAP
jgi:hypothetical protein